MNDTPEKDLDEATAEPAAETTQASPGKPAEHGSEAPEQAADQVHEHTDEGTAEPVAEQAEAEHQDQLPEHVADQLPEEPVAEQGYGRRLELILEALLLAADAPLPLEQMQKLVASEFNLGRKDLRAALERMSARYADTACELQEVASGWRLQVRAEFGEWVGRLWQEKPPKYSRALLETLALIVYRQPITRGEIEDVRGVAVSTNILRTLLERGWVREVGHKEVPGRPALYGTAPQFLDDFNLKSLDQLPTLPEIKDLDQLEAAMKRLGQNADAVAELRAEREAAEDPMNAGAALPESHDDGSVVHEALDEEAPEEGTIDEGMVDDDMPLDEVPHDEGVHDEGVHDHDVHDEGAHEADVADDGTEDPPRSDGAVSH
ncbi:SMC-Scp complex subunit ScpB [Nevskia soli]|uniref:SMC-Scp complex subunit ScpB n=1 Tax=Nevskia soli TaxID=418856 RepID=UPI000A04E440|nr:SMC-Scp complex subunit ScpB [Nevskia soli]